MQVECCFKYDWKGFTWISPPTETLLALLCAFCGQFHQPFMSNLFTDILASNKLNLKFCTEKLLIWLLHKKSCSKIVGEIDTCSLLSSPWVSRRIALKDVFNGGAPFCTVSIFYYDWIKKLDVFTIKVRFFRNDETV